MSRPWGPTGVDDFEFGILDPEDRKHIQNQLHAVLRIESAPEEFFRDLEGAIGMYDSGQTLQHQSRPSELRKNLRNCLKAVDMLTTQLKAVDGNSWRLIRRYTDRTSLDELDWLLPLLSAGILAALDHAKKYPTAGRLVDYARLLLAVDVGRALQKHLDVAPTATREGLFESLVGIVLRIAAGRTPKEVPDETMDVHDLICRAVNHLKQENSTPEQKDSTKNTYTLSQVNAFYKDAALKASSGRMSQEEREEFLRRDALYTKAAFEGRITG